MERIRFEGYSAKEAEEFVATVNRTALKEGKHKDPEWIAFFASSCFSGVALRWLADLDYEVTYDWNLLRRAILQRWPIETKRNIIAIPPSAAAAPPPSAFKKVAPEPSQQPFLLMCTCCGAYRPAIDQDFCGQRCSSDDNKPASTLIGFGSPTSKDFPFAKTGTARTEGERKKTWEEMTPEERRKQRELEREKDLEIDRRRQQLVDDAEARRRLERTTQADKDTTWRRTRHQDSTFEPTSFRSFSGAYRPPGTRNFGGGELPSTGNGAWKPKFRREGQ